MKANRLLIILSVALMFVGINASADSLLDGKKWTKASSQIGAGSKGNLQGSAFLPAALNGIDGKDRIYCFKHGSDNLHNSYDYYEPSTGTWIKGADSFDWAPQTHMGSVSFGPEVVSSYTGSDGKTYTCKIPFAYASGHAYLDSNGNIVAQGTAGATRYITSVVMDLENNRIVKVFVFPNRTDDCIIAYNWGTKDAQSHRYGSIGVIGYQQNVTGKSPYVLDQYYRVDMNDFLSANPNKWNYTDIPLKDKTGKTNEEVYNNLPATGVCGLRVMVGGPDTDGIQKTLECGTIQDAFFHNDRIYIVTGRGSLYNRTEFVKIHSYYVGTENGHERRHTEVVPLHGESQGLVFDGTNIWITLSGSNIGESGLYKFSPRNGDTSHDNLNFQKPERISGTDENDPDAVYRITNGYELGWFLMQVYSGRTTISCELANDIDMLGIKLPTTYYVYEKVGSSGTYTFESQYAFRGTFDGQHHTISNLSVTQTPFYNDGLFPWIIDATVKDVTVEGNITLTKADNNNGALGKQIENVGFIGNAEGDCTITGIDVSNFSINNPSNLTTSNIGPLVGQTNGNDYTTGNTISKGSHDGKDHSYANGVCIYEHTTEDGLYQPAELVNGVYQIANAGNLIWFAKSINGATGYTKIALNSKAVLTADINMEGTKYGSFPGIGVSTTGQFQGTFDGQGHTIRNFYMATSATRSGMFNSVFGYKNSGNQYETAVVKNFTLNGTMTVSGNAQMVGSVVGNLMAYSMLEDVTSSVNIICDGGSQMLGGLVGCLNSTDGTSDKTTVMNRCRYNGTIQSGSMNGVGGVVGCVRYGYVQNCLFDGKIVSNLTSDDTSVGGIVGMSDQTGTLYLQKCLVEGSISVNATTNKSGYVVGNSKQIIDADSKAGYVTTGSVNISKAIGAATGANQPALSYMMNVESYTGDQKVTYLGSDNWKILAGNAYPIPMAGDPHTHSWDDYGYCIAHDGYQPAEIVDGYYAIRNAGNLCWFAEAITNGEIDLKSNAKLMNDIDMHMYDSANPSAAPYGYFPRIGGSTNTLYAGTFDGQGHTISNIKMISKRGENRSGMFYATTGAVVKNFNVNGRHVIANNPSVMHGTITGDIHGATYQDIHSSVDISVITTKTNVTSIGGIAGATVNGGTLNRCWYSGTISVNNVNYKYIGGIVGEYRAGTISNCLFDGTITCQSTNADLSVGGIVGYATTAVTLNTCLSHGTITLPSGPFNKSGVVFGYATVKVDALNTYYTTTHCTNLSAAYGSDCTNMAATFRNVTPTEEMKELWDGTAHFYLGQTNWHMDSLTDSAGYPKPIAGGSHVHKYDADGYCLASDGFEQPTVEAGYFQIAKRGNLYWYLNYVNGTLGASDKYEGKSQDKAAKAKLTADIDLQNAAFAGFNSFAGEFDGQGHTISGWSKDIASKINQQGFFNTVAGASATNKAIIRNFTLEGALTLNYKGDDFCYFNGAVVGCASAHTLVEDVTSRVNITVSGGKERGTGGIIGCAKATTVTLNRCRYQGTITSKVSYNGNYVQALAGIVGNSRGGQVTNCLFEGTIVTEADNCNVAGIVGSISDTKGTNIKNCLSIGTYTLAGNTNNQCAQILGTCPSTQSTTGSVSDCYYKEGIDGIGFNNNNNVTSARVASTTSVALVNGETCALLNANSGQWSQVLGYQTGANKTSDSPAQANPVPGTQYPVMKDADNNYTIGYYFFDDNGDTTPLPRDAASIKAKKIKYTRNDNSLTGTYGSSSVCLPFAYTLSTKPVMTFNCINGAGNAVFNIVNGGVMEAGKPYLVFGLTELNVNLEDNEGIDISLEPSNGANLLGVFNTTVIGGQFYKLNNEGNKLLKTTESSHCFPYRAYFNLPSTAGSVKSMAYEVNVDE